MKGSKGFSAPNLQLAFAVSVAAMPDMDGDGLPELAVGAINDFFYNGAVYILLLRADGTVRRSFQIDPFDQEGYDMLGASSIACLPDLDGNGLPELAAGAIGPDGGRIFVLYLGRNASLTVKKPLPQEYLEHIDLYSTKEFDSTRP